MAGARGSADGRVLRGRRNREAVVEAFLSLLEDGDPRPTARAIAARAGISVRSVFQHFDDLEQIYEIAGRREVSRLAPLLQPVDTTLPLPERIDRYVERRSRLLEELDPVARAARLREPFSEQLRTNRATLVGLLAQQVAATFAPELAGADDPEHLLLGIVTASSWAAWDHLRGDHRAGEADARRVVARLLSGLLAPIGDPLAAN